MPKQPINIVGIIPVAGTQGEFGFEWPDCLTPIAPNYTAVESSVYECAHAGCTSIWIVCNDDVAPLIKHRVGEFCVDQASAQRGYFTKHGNNYYQDIPIYYVPIHPKHRDKVDCYGWSIIYGANVAYWITKKFSRWTTPDTYYISFPFGVSDPREIIRCRKFIRTKEPFYFSYKGLTVKDNIPLSFTMQPDEWRRAKHIITTNSKLYEAPPPGEMPSVKLPKEKRYQSRWFTLADVFGDGPEGKESELSWFYDLTTWAEYSIFIGSEHSELLRRPSNTVMYMNHTGGIVSDK